MHIVIPTTFTGTRRNSGKPKLLTKFVNGSFLFENQINTLTQLFKTPQITYISSFNYDKIDIKLTKFNVNIIHNEKYQETNIAYSIYLGLNDIKSGCLIIYGDLFLTTEYFENVNFGKKSFVLIDRNENFGKKEIGLGPNKLFNYGFLDKWSQIFYLNSKDIILFKDIISKKKNNRKFVFEILNEMVELGCEFDIIEGTGKIFEINKLKDVIRVNRYLHENSN